MKTLELKGWVTELVLYVQIEVTIHEIKSQQGEKRDSELVIVAEVI